MKSAHQQSKAEVNRNQGQHMNERRKKGHNALRFTNGDYAIGMHSEFSLFTPTERYALHIYTKAASPREQNIEISLKTNWEVKNRC